MNKIDLIIDEFKSLEEVKRLKELEPIIDKNVMIKKELDELLKIQKILIHKRYYKENDLDVYEALYNKKRIELIEMPFLDEYLELLDIISEKLNNFKYELERKLELEINV